MKDIKGLFLPTIFLSYIVGILMIVYGVMIYNYFFESIATLGMELIIILAIIYCAVATLLFLRKILIEYIYIWLTTLIGVIFLGVVLSQGFKMSVISVYGMMICIAFLAFNLFLHSNYFLHSEILTNVFLGSSNNSTPYYRTTSKKTVTKSNIKIKPAKKNRM